MKILANEKIFHEWEKLGEKITDMKCFVQNDNDSVSFKEYVDFIGMTMKLKMELENLISLTDNCFNE